MLLAFPFTSLLYHIFLNHSRVNQFLTFLRVIVSINSPVPLQPQRHPLCTACPRPVEMLRTVAPEGRGINPLRLRYEPTQPVGVLRVSERPQGLCVLFPGLCLCNPACFPHAAHGKPSLVTAADYIRLFPRQAVHSLPQEGAEAFMVYSLCGFLFQITGRGRQISQCGIFFPFLAPYRSIQAAHMAHTGIKL